MIKCNTSEARIGEEKRVAVCSMECLKCCGLKTVFLISTTNRMKDMADEIA